MRRLMMLIDAFTDRWEVDCADGECRAPEPSPAIRARLLLLLRKRAVDGGANFLRLEAVITTIIIIIITAVILIVVDLIIIRISTRLCFCFFLQRERAADRGRRRRVDRNAAAERKYFNNIQIIIRRRTKTVINRYIFSTYTASTRRKRERERETRAQTIYFDSRRLRDVATTPGQHTGGFAECFTKIQRG